MGRPVTQLRALARAAARPRMLGLAAILAVVATGCVLLGNWQLGRAQSRAEAAAEAQIDKENQAGAVDLAAVLQPQTAFPGSALGRLVTAGGVWGDDWLVVPGRVVDGDHALIVLAPLEVAQGDGTSAVLTVALGWKEPGAPLPTGPSAATALAGYLAPGEAPNLEDAGPGAVSAISPAQLLHTWGQPIYTGYLVASGTAVPAGLRELPRPTPPVVGWNMQNLFYALEWWVFGGFALVVWLKVIRDQARLDHPELWRASRRAPSSPAASDAGAG